MHNGNHSWLKDLAVAYEFKNKKVLDIGSLNVNGTCRDYFTDCDYTGVDQKAGRGVDIVAVATDTKFEPETFDIVISFNCYEHDFDWKNNVNHNLQWLKKGGYFIAEFGSTGNAPHYFPVWLAVPHDEFVENLKEQGCEVLENFWEKERYSSTQNGIYCVVAKKC
jgi:SAM-dependent methyltransferase